MNLPELTWQIAFGRVAWAMVMAAFLVALLPRKWLSSRMQLRGLMLACMVLQFLPGEASLSYWLGLSFQWPSGLLTGLCLAKLTLAWNGAAPASVMRTWLALPIVLAGSILYLEAMGILATGLYYRGFGPVGAPAIALVLAMGCTWLAVRGQARAQAMAILLATSLFCIFRLPSGNLWDALLDPLLWAWAGCALARRGWRRLRSEPVAIAN
jgi:hypothetical protein